MFRSNRSLYFRQLLAPYSQHYEVIMLIRYPSLWVNRTWSISISRVNSTLSPSRIHCVDATRIVYTRAWMLANVPTYAVRYVPERAFRGTTATWSILDHNWWKHQKWSTVPAENVKRGGWIHYARWSNGVEMARLKWRWFIYRSMDEGSYRMQIRFDLYNGYIWHAFSVHSRDA